MLLCFSVLIQPVTTYAENCLTDINLHAKQIHCTSKLNCTFQNAELTICKKSSVKTKLYAKHLHLSPDKTLTLRRPVLKINNIPVAALPWIKLLPPDRFGFLMPKLQYTSKAGLNIGPSFYIPLSNSRFITASAAIRTNDGMDARLTFNSSKGFLNIDYLLMSKQNHAQIELKSASPLKNTTSSADILIATDKKTINQLNFLSTKRALTHTDSRIHLSTQGDLHLFSSNAFYIQPIDTASTNNSLFTHSSSLLKVKSDISKLLLNGIMQPSLSMSIERIFSDNTLYRPQTRFILTPKLSLPFNAGPFKITVSSATIHKALLADDQIHNSNFNSITSSLLLELPLLLTKPSLSHLLTLALSYNITPWAIGTQPDKPVELSDTITTGQLIFSQIKNKFILQKNIVADINLGFMLNPSGFSNPLSRSWWLTAGITKENLSLNGIMGFQTKSSTPGYSTLLLNIKDIFSSSYTSGIVYINLKNISTNPGFLQNRLWYFLPSSSSGSSMFIFKNRLSINLTGILTAIGDIQIDILNHFKITSLRYGLQLSDPCKCLKIALIASHRPDLKFPDIMLSLRLDNI